MQTLEQMLDQKGGKWGLTTVFYPSPDSGDAISAVIETDYETILVENGAGDKESLAKKVALIAAAPELLEALEALLEGRATKPPPDNPAVPKDGISWRNWRMFEKARAAIAKAKGET